METMDSCELDGDCDNGEETVLVNTHHNTTVRSQSGEILQNIEHSGETLQNIEHSGETLQNIEHSGETLQNIEHSGETLQNIGHSGETLQNIEHSGETLQNIEHSGETLQNIEHSGETLQNIEHSGETLQNIGHSGETLQNIEHSGETLQNIEHSGETLQNIEHSGETLQNTGYSEHKMKANPDTQTEYVDEDVDEDEDTSISDSEDSKTDATDQDREPLLQCLRCNTKIYNVSDVERHFSSSNCGNEQSASSTEAGRSRTDVRVKQEGRGRESAGSVESPLISQTETEQECTECSKTFPSLAEYRDHQCLGQTKTSSVVQRGKNDFKLKVIIKKEEPDRTSTSPSGNEEELSDDETCSDIDETDVTQDDEVLSLTDEAEQVLETENTDQPSSSRASTKPRKLHTCQLCPYSSVHRANVNRHNRAVHLKQKYSCDDCGIQYASRYDLKEHVRGEHQNIPLVCEICLKTFMNRKTLNMHRIRAHDTSRSKYTCELCSQMYVDWAHFQGHMNSHLETKPFSCTTCDRSYTYKSSLHKHSKQCKGKPDQSEVKIYECSLCGEVLTSMAGLRDHEKGKHGPKDQVCMCGKMFAWRTSLIRHKRVCKLLN